MKRVAWPLVLAFLSFNTLGFTPTAAPTRPISSATHNPAPLLQPLPLALAIPGKNARCENIGPTRVCASVYPARVGAHAYITVYGMVKVQGVGQPGLVMTATWRSKSVGSCSAVTDSQGMASCTTWFPGATKGHSVRVKVSIGKYKLTTHFTAK